MTGDRLDPNAKTTKSSEFRKLNSFKHFGRSSRVESQREIQKNTGRVLRHEEADKQANNSGKKTGK